MCPRAMFVPRRAAFGPSARALLMLDSWPRPLPWSGGNGLSPSLRMCLRRRKGWGAALSRSRFRPPAPQPGLAMGMAPADGCSPSWGLWQRLQVERGGAEMPLMPSPALVTLVPQFPWQTVWLRPPSGQSQMMQKSIWPSIFGDPSPHSPEPRHSRDRTHSPAAWLPAALAWDLSHFWGTEGLGEPRTPSAGTLCHCWGSVLTGGRGSAAGPL